jgi:recombinational DNA repair protein RecT
MTQIATQPSKTISALLANDKVQQRIGDALGEGVDQNQFMAQLQISLSRDDLRECDVNSLYAAAHTCACLGLLPSLKQIAIIPRQVKDKQGRVIRTDADVMPQWQGYKAIMMRNPEVLDVHAFLVHPEDEFHCDPTLHPPVHHRFDPFSGERVFKNFDQVRGGYLKIEWRDRARPDKYHFVSCDNIRKARSCALTGKIWEAWFEEQCLKTVYRNAFARQVIAVDMQVNRALQRLTQIEDQLHSNDPARVGPSQQQRLTHQPVSRAQAITERMNPVKSTPVEEPESVAFDTAAEADTNLDSFPPDDPAPEKPKKKGSLLPENGKGDYPLPH